jgi:ATP-dependent protease ClpP protease subunit
MASFYIYGDINEKTALSFNKFVRRRILATEDSLTVYINTHGGEYESACSIIDTINTLKREGTEVVTVVDGKAYSAGAFIFCFGSRRIVQERSVLMFHPIQLYDSGTQSVGEAKSLIDFTTREYSEIISGIINACNLTLSEKELYAKFKDCWWLSSTEALEYGFATERAV